MGSRMSFLCTWHMCQHVLFAYYHKTLPHSSKSIEHMHTMHTCMQSLICAATRTEISHADIAPSCSTVGAGTCTPGRAVAGCVGQRTVTVGCL